MCENKWEMIPNKKRIDKKNKKKVDRSKEFCEKSLHNFSDYVIMMAG